MKGIGLSNLNKLIASMDALSLPLYTRIHNSVSNMWKAAAEETMLNAAKQETEEANIPGEINKAGIAMIALEADACCRKLLYKNNFSALVRYSYIEEHSGKVHWRS